MPSVNAFTGFRPRAVNKRFIAVGHVRLRHIRGAKVHREDLSEAVRDDGNYHTKFFGGREIICFRYKGYEITTDYSSDHHVYESVITKMDDGEVLYSVMDDFHRGAFSLAVVWLARQLDPQLDLF